MTAGTLLATPAALIAAALLIEAAFGYPGLAYRAVRHPVVWIGTLIGLCDRALNRSAFGDALRRALGVATVLVIVGLTIAATWALAWLLPNDALGFTVQAVLASTLLAQRSLHDHVAAVATPLGKGDLTAARSALGKIVGRNVQRLDESAASRAAIESLSENLSDGVVAPAFWGAFFGLPGIAAYKAINTLDSMIGHRTDRHRAFGWAAARLDDLANLIPARLTALLLALAALPRTVQAAACAFADAARHRSPNAGWPEAAMAGALGVRLSGPRVYAAATAEEPWLNATARDPGAADIGRGLTLQVRACALLWFMIAALALVQAW